MIMPFDMTVFHYGCRLLLLPIILCSALWLTSTNAQAASSISCTANMSNVEFDKITLANADSAPTSGTLSYSCENKGNTTGYVSVCLAADGGYEHKNISKRRMRLIANPDENELAFNMKLPLQGNHIWGNLALGDGIEYQSGVIAIAPGSLFSKTEPVSIFLVSGEKNTQVLPGIYSNNINDINHGLKYARSDSATLPLDCKTKNSVSAPLPFTVRATVTASCFINSTPHINLQYAGPNNITEGNGAINVTCTPGVTYNMGLLSLNNSDASNGIGIMKGSKGNPDTIHYQLRSNSGSNGTPWGNTVTATNVGNGVTDDGDGKPKSHTVYITVPKTNVRPDTYSDTVTVTVYF